MIEVKQIAMDEEEYSQEQELRNKILLRPIGLPDHAWEKRDREADHFVALQEGRVVGCLIFVQNSTSSGQLMQMAVETELQGKGVGGMLVQELVTHAMSRKFEEVTCHARSSAVEFYRRHGFKVFGEPFDEVGVPHRHMVLKL